MRILHASVAIGALLAAMPASAQDATPTTGAQPATETIGIDDIIVTAQRREENSQRAAVAIDVISPQSLANAGAITPTSLNAAVPSLFVARGGGANTSFFIRGVGNFTNNGYSDPAIAFNVDGVYYGRPTSTTGTFYDLERIEVLKGPQGTLYGRNATAGAINILPAKPRLGEVSGYASAGYGRFNAIEAEGALNLPLGTKAALRVSAKFAQSDGFNDDGTGDEDGEAFRAQLRADLTDTFSIRLSADYSHNGGVGPGGAYLGRVTPSPGSPATATSPANYTYTPSGLDIRGGLLSPAQRAYFGNVILGGPQIRPAPIERPFQDNEYYGGHAEINLETGIGTFTVVPAYRHSKLDNLFNGPSFRGGLIDETDKQFSVEARLTGERVGPIDWLIGGFYIDEDIRGRYTFSQYAVQSFQRFTTGTESYAAFGRVTAHLTDQFRLVGGLRYTDDSKVFNGGATNLVQICTNPPTPAGPGCVGGPSVPVSPDYATLASLIPAAQIPQGLPTLPGPPNGRPFGANGNRLFIIPFTINSRQDTDKITYRLAAEFDAGPNSLLYASYETGYRSGGFSVSLGRESYRPEFIRALTIGAKNRFFDNRLQLNVELFRWKYRDQQVAHFGLDITGNNSNFSENIGRSTIQGVDLDMQFKAARTTLLRASLQYLDNKLDSFVYDVAQTSLPIVGCPFSPAVDQFGRPSFRVNCSGKPGFNAPKWTSNLGFDQTFELDAYKLTLTGDGRYRSNRVIGFEYLPIQNSGSQFTIDASLSFGPIDGRWSVTGYVLNLTNKAIPVLTQFAGSTGNVVVSTLQPPRSYGVRGRFNF